MIYVFYAHIALLRSYMRFPLARKRIYMYIYVAKHYFTNFIILNEFIDHITGYKINYKIYVYNIYSTKMQ